jgi:hypothetical protein
MTLPWWGWTALVVALAAGPVLVLAPVIGAWWAQLERPMPEDQVPQTVRAAYWSWVRGRRSP